MGLFDKVRAWLSGDTAHRLFDQGFAHYKRGELDEAVKAYTSSIGADANFAWSYDGRGNVQCEKGDYEAGLADYLKATAPLPDHAGMLGNLGRCYRLLGRFAEAKDVLERAYKLDPAHANNIWFLAETLGALGDKEAERDAYVRFRGIAAQPADLAFAEARIAALDGEPTAQMAALDKVIALEPSRLDAQQERALLKASTGDHAAAIDGFTAVIDKARVTATALWNRAASYQSTGKHALAVADLDLVLAQGHASAELFIARGWNRQKLGEREGALSDYAEAIKLAPDTYEPYARRLDLAFAARDHDTVVSDAGKLIALQPQNPRGYFGRAAGLFAMERYAQALGDYDHILRADPDQPEALLYRAATLEELGDMERMRADYERYLGLVQAAETADRLNGRAWAKLMLGKPSDALDDADRAVALDPGSAGYLGTRGHVLAALGRRDEAIRDLEAALGKDPFTATERVIRRKLAELKPGSA